MKRFVSIAISIVLLLTVVSGCSASAKTSASTTTASTAAATSAGSSASAAKEFKPSGKVVKCASMINGDGLALAYAVKKGYFTELGLKVEAIYFANGVLCNEGLAAGAADVAANGYAGVYGLATGEFKLIGDVDVDNGGALGLYVRPDSPLLKVRGKFSSKYPEVYGDAETAKGTNWLVSLGTAQQCNIDKYMQKLGVKDYKITGMDPASALNALLSGQGDGASFSPPYTTKAEKAGLVRVCTYRESVDGTTGSTLMVKNDFYNNRYSDLVLWTRAYYKAVTELEKNPKVRFTEGMEFFAKQGTAYSEEDMNAEIENRRYHTAETLAKPGFELGYQVVFSAMYLTEIGKLTTGQAKIIADCTTGQVLKDALGIDAKVGFPAGYEKK